MRNFNLVELIFVAIILLCSTIGFVGSSIVPTLGWIIFSIVASILLVGRCIPKYRNGPNEGISFDIDRHQKWHRYLIFLSILFIIGIESTSYFVYGLKPVGWDTAQHLYMSRLIIDGDIFLMLELVSGNNFLPYLLVATTSLFNVNFFFIMRIILTIVLSLLLLFVIKIIADKKFTSPSLSAITVALTAVWLSTYRLSADLHKTLISLICLLAIIYLLDSKEMSRKNGTTIMLLSVCISFSQLEMSFLFSAILLLQIIYNQIKKLGKFKNMIKTWLIVTCSSIPALIIAASYSIRFISVTITYDTPVNAPDYLTVSYALGASLLPFVIAGICFYCYDFLFDNSNLDIISFFTLTIIFGLIVPSFFISYPTLFRIMAPRLFFVIPVPLIVTDSIRRVNFTLQGNWLNKKVLTLRPLLSSGIAIMILVAAVGTPQLAIVHHHPFIDEQAYSELQSLSSINLSNRVVFVTFESISQYRDDGWVGAFIGNHYAWNGPLVYLLAGVVYPTLVDYDRSYSEKALSRLLQDDMSFPLIDSSIDIVTTSSFYGPLTVTVAERSSEVAEGVFFFTSEARVLLLENYSISVKRPYDYSGTWRFYNYAILDSGNLTGDEFISYPVLFPDVGNYSISITYRDVSTSYSNVSVMFDEDFLGTLNNTGASYYKQVQYHILNNATSVHYITFNPSRYDWPSYISITSLLIAKIM